MGSSSRGAQIAFIFCFTLMFWKRLFKIRIIVLGLAVMWGSWQLLPDEQKLRFTEIGTDKTSIQRTLYWKHGWQMMKDHPVLGVGYYNFIPYYTAYHSQDMLYDKAELPHNIFIQVGTDGGFVALFFYCGIIFVNLIGRRKIPDENKEDQILGLIWKGNKLAIIGFVIAGQFVTVGYYPFLWICVTLQVSLQAIYKNQEGRLKAIAAS